MTTIMSKDEIKYEINKVLDHLPNTALEELLQFLKKIDSNTSSIKAHLDKIISEDHSLLERLAK